MRSTPPRDRSLVKRNQTNGHQHDSSRRTNDLPFRLATRISHCRTSCVPCHARRRSLLNLEPLTLPTPVFPQHPELLSDEQLLADIHGKPDNPYARHWTGSQVLRAMRGWLVPYMK